MYVVQPPAKRKRTVSDTLNDTATPVGKFKQGVTQDFEVEGGSKGTRRCRMAEQSSVENKEV